MIAERSDGTKVELSDHVKLFECMLCGFCHPQNYNGDCRDNDNRFLHPEDLEALVDYFDEDDNREC